MDKVIVAIRLTILTILGISASCLASGKHIELAAIALAVFTGNILLSIDDRLRQLADKIAKDKQDDRI